MRNEAELRDRRLLLEVAQITHEYGALHRRTLGDLARARAELAAAHRVLGTVAHDLRSPLAAAVGFTELLLEEDQLTADQREYSERVHSAASAMVTLVDELVEAVTVGGSPTRSEPVDVSQLVMHTVTRSQMLLPPRGICVVLDPVRATDAALVVQGDESKLERLLDNLISNAVKFSPDQGRVRVGLRGDGHQIEIRVGDEGPGLAPEQQAAIFLPFHRAPGAASVPGVGLGLTIVKHITDAHGGRVHVESVLGHGATFVVSLPSARPR